MATEVARRAASKYFKSDAVWPIEDGFAPLGLIDKYLSGGAVAGISRSGDEVTVALRDAGKFGAWSERTPVAARWIPAGAEARTVPVKVEGSGLMTVDLPKTGRRQPGDLTLIFTRP